MRRAGVVLALPTGFGRVGQGCGSRSDLTSGFSLALLTGLGCTGQGLGCDTYRAGPSLRVSESRHFVFQQFCGIVVVDALFWSWPMNQLRQVGAMGSVPHARPLRRRYLRRVGFKYVDCFGVQTATPACILFLCTVAHL